MSRARKFKAMLAVIEYAGHSIDEHDVDAVVRVLRSKRLTQGPEIAKFEEELSHAVGAPYAVSFANGSAALHGALSALDICSGEVIVSALTFVSEANVVLAQGAKPVFADIDPETWNITADSVREHLSSKTAAVIVTHFAGLPADIKEIAELGVPVIEDACHALGSPRIGACEFSQMSCFSFHPSKAITTGEGGAVTTRTNPHKQALKHFRNHGFYVYDDPRLGGTWYREQRSMGFNYRMSDIHAALGRSQLPKLEKFITRRHEIAGRYLEELNGVVQLPPYSPHHAWHLFVIRHPARDAIYEALKERGIQTQVHYVPLYRNPVHEGQPLEDFPATEAYFRECLSLPIFPRLTDDEQTKVIEAIVDVV